jgi:hypothetical protein
MAYTPLRSIDGILADTWWYGLTKRLSAADFRRLATLRAQQGFNAVQLVAGIPPEVGPASPHAASDVGVAWTPDGRFNDAYLKLARDRITLLNSHGLRALVYGAWGHQIGWLGRERMTTWWQLLVRNLDDLDVVYCLTGELTLWVGQEDLLLPDKSTDVLTGRRRSLPWLLRRLPRRALGTLHGLAARDPRRRRRMQQRKIDWTFVLEQLAASTDRPILVHPNALESGRDSVLSPDVLAADTTQTGHSYETRDLLWQMPLRSRGRFINLEPWYEGIHGQFGPSDQLYAFWVSVLAGATGYCYGAHGIWNVGDGTFLAHWGTQTFAAAMELETPWLLGDSNAIFQQWGGRGESVHAIDGGVLTMIGRCDGDDAIRFFPDVRETSTLPAGRYWLPRRGCFATDPPVSGAVVVLSGSAATL